MIETMGSIAPRWKQIEKPRHLDYEKDTLSDSYGKFIAEPFERGYAHTVGNALRRILLSSIPGAAVTSVRIEGAAHEFAIMEGVKEDVVDIILNLKQLRVRLHGDQMRTLELKVKGQKKVTAADFTANAAVEIVNPNLHIATLTEDDSELDISLELAWGRGYVPSERNKKEGAPIGIVPVDSLFSPVTKVTYRAEDTRVGQMTDYDKLILEIWTDGRIKPEDALARAASILRDHATIFLSLDQAEAAPVPSEEESRIRDLLRVPITELELSMRSMNCLQNAEVKTLRDLVSRNEEEVLKFRNFGSKSLEEVNALLADMGLSLGMDLSKYPAEPAVEA